jgi:hypothetical protein
MDELLSNKSKKLFKASLYINTSKLSIYVANHVKYSYKQLQLLTNAYKPIQSLWFFLCKFVGYCNFLSLLYFNEIFFVNPYFRSARKCVSRQPRPTNINTVTKISSGVNLVMNLFLNLLQKGFNCNFTLRQVDSY